MKLADYLTQHQLDDAAFADRCGVDRTTILRIRLGQTKPSDPLKERIAQETGGLVRPDDYFDGLPQSEAA